MRSQVAQRRQTLSGKLIVRVQRWFTKLPRRQTRPSVPPDQLIQVEKIYLTSWGTSFAQRHITGMDRLRREFRGLPKLLGIEIMRLRHQYFLCKLAGDQPGIQWLHDVLEGKI